MEILKIAAIGIGGFVLYEYLSGAFSSTVATTAVTPVVTSNPNLVLVQSISAAKLETAAAGASMLTVDQWNYYFTALTGQPGPTLVNKGQQIDVNTYYNALLAWANGTATGLSGGIINIVPNSKLGWGVGENDFLYGLGMILGARTGQMGMNGIGGIVDDPNNSAAYIDEQTFYDAWGVNGSLDSSTADFYAALGLQTS